MADTQAQLLADFLNETEPLIESVDRLPIETASELYGLYDKAARSAASAVIGPAGAETRARLCERLDIILERIIDIIPPRSLTKRQTKAAS